MSIQRIARGVRVAAQQGYLVGRLRGSGQTKLVPVQELAAALGATGQVAIPGAAPPATIVAAGTGISVSLGGVTYTVTNTGVLSNIAGSNITVSGATGNVTVALATSPALTGTPTAPTAAAGTNTTQIATTAFVATAIGDFDLKNPVVAATTAALPFSPTYTNGSSGVGAKLTGGVGILAFDGYTPVLGDRLLIKNQGSSFQNGIYTVTVVGTVILGYELTRATDFNQTINILYGDTVGVLQGTVNANQQFTMNNNNPITVGTTAITFAQTSGGSQLSAGIGITITGNSVALTTPVSATNGGTGANLSATGGTSQFVKQTLAGGAFTVATLTSTDLSANNGAGAANKVLVNSGATRGDWSGVLSLPTGATNNLVLDTFSLSTNYNVISLNAQRGASFLGFAGGGVGDDNMYVNVPTGGKHKLQVNNVTTITWQNSGAVDFSATGGSNQIVKQTSAGGAFTVGTQALSEHSDFTALTSNTPTVTAAGGTYTTVSGSQKYTKHGNLLLVTGSVTITTNGTANTFTIVTIPGGFTLDGTLVGYGKAAGVSGKMLSVTQWSGTEINIANYDNTYPGANGELLVFQYVVPVVP